MSRGCPVSRMPADWSPPVPAYSSQMPTGEVVILYIACQAAQRSDALRGLSTLRDFLACDPQPAHVDLALHQPSGRPVDAIAIAYFETAKAFETWSAASGFNQWWSNEQRVWDGCGYWQERLSLPANRIEALHSSPMPEGHSFCGTLIGPVREHAYWGGMRDRIELSASDWLDSPRAGELRPRSAVPPTGRVIVDAPENLCVIRSGQDLSDIDAQEMQVYDEVVHGNLVEGMRFLAEDGAAVGCCDARFCTEITADGAELRRTFGHCLFLTLQHLETWASSHPSHLAIFNSFFEMLRRRDNASTLKLWHEVAVLPASGQRFEYINCHPDTGLLGLFPAT